MASSFWVTPVYSGGNTVIFSKKPTSKETVSLYRAVKPEEYGQLVSDGMFKNPVEIGVERKYFSTTLEGAEQYARMAEAAFGDQPYKIIKAEVPKNITDKILNRVMVDSGIDAILIETVDLKYISRAELVLDNSQKMPKNKR